MRESIFYLLSATLHLKAQVRQPRVLSAFCRRRTDQHCILDLASWRLQGASRLRRVGLVIALFQFIYRTRSDGAVCLCPSHLVEPKTIRRFNLATRSLIRERGETRTHLLRIVLAMAHTTKTILINRRDVNSVTCFFMSAARRVAAHLSLHWTQAFVRFGWGCVASPHTLGLRKPGIVEFHHKQGTLPERTFPDNTRRTNS